MKADARETFRLLSLSEVAIEDPLQGGITGIALGCGKPVLVVPASAVRLAQTRISGSEDRQPAQRDRTRGKKSQSADHLPLPVETNRPTRDTQWRKEPRHCCVLPLSYAWKPHPGSRNADLPEIGVSGNPIPVPCLGLLPNLSKGCQICLYWVEEAPNPAAQGSERCGPSREGRRGSK